MPRVQQTNRDTKKSISFRSLIPANTEKWFHHRIEGEATIEELRVKFYRGQQLALKVIPYLELKGINSLEPLVIFAQNTDQFLAGDDDYLIFPIDYPAKNDDYIKIYAKNEDLTYDYNLSLDIVIDYLGGQNRVI